MKRRQMVVLFLVFAAHLSIVDPAHAAPVIRNDNHPCRGGASVGEHAVVGGVSCADGSAIPVRERAPAAPSGERPFLLEVSERVDEPGCSGSPDGLRITETKSFLDGLLPAEDVRAYCWTSGLPRPGSDAGVASPPSVEQVMAQVPIPEPVVNISPHVRGLVGFETWLWYDQPATLTLPPLTLEGWTVAAELAVVELAWDMGNGDVVTGSGPGTEADPSGFYVYENDCRPCTVTVAVTWSGSSTVSHPSAPAPASFDLGRHVFTAEVVYDVPEVEAVVVG